ncbi:MAG TPA: hypothetical protein VGB85_11345 [Nannocystis sp.]
MRSTLIALAFMTGGCLVEYVLPEGDSSGGDTDDSMGHVVTGDPAPTSTAGTTGDIQTTGDPCDEGLTRCGDACVDLSRDDAHCGSCDEYCKSDERCIASECRDILPVDCAACPCDACPEASGIVESTTSGGGSDAEKHLCCPPPDGAEAVLCVVGDAEDPLVCPTGGD